MVVHKINDSKSILLASIFVNGKIGILERDKETGGDFRFSWSNDGVIFTPDYEKVLFVDGLLRHKPDQCSNISFFFVGKKIFVAYLRTVKTKIYKVIAESKNVYEWEVVSEIISSSDSEFVVVSEEKNAKKLLAYEGGVFIKSLLLNDFESWQEKDSLLFTTRFEHFDRNSIKLIGSYISDKGIVVFYESIIKEKNNYQPAIGFVIFDKKNTDKILYRSSDPIWRSDVWFSENNICKSLGMVLKDNNLFFFFTIDSTLITVSLTEDSLSLHIPQAAHKALVKHKNNPIISPHPHNKWENEAIFNPAAILDDEGHTHLIYRAIGSDGVSRLGYGYSKDGITFNGRLSIPLFAMGNPRGKGNVTKTYSPIMFPSGGSWGGCEDPRAVRIDGKIYVTFNAFDGWDFMRIGVISMDEDKFFKNNWEWSKPLFISPRNEINKNWVLFPEKINGKFAILHRIWPKIGVEYVDKLEELEKNSEKIEKHWTAAYYSDMPKHWIPVYQGTPGAKWVNPEHIENGTWNSDENKSWDTWIRSAGPPPIKTKDGWLVLYHAMDEKEKHSGYKLGAMLLDLKDPEKIISRLKFPVISPDKWYESDWKPRIVYACGAAIKNETLFIYYGGGDKHVCVATIPLEKLLKDMINSKVIIRSKKNKK